MISQSNGAAGTLSPYTCYVAAREAAEAALRQLDAIGAAMHWTVPADAEPDPRYKLPPALVREPQAPSFVATVEAAMTAADHADRVQQATVYAEPVPEDVAELLAQNGVKPEGLVYNADGTLRKRPGRKPRAKPANDLPTA